MKLVGARVAKSATEAVHKDLTLENGRFAEATAGPGIDLSGYLILPGLINAHDHLDLDLFPRLGSGTYRNATEWAADIYRPDDSPVKEQLSVPKAVRLTWGGIRNLLSGVTTVAHHNPYCSTVFENNFPVRVPREIGWAHSLKFSPNLAERFLGCPAEWPFVIHAAEGTDDVARGEIRCLDALGILSERTVLVHAVGADSQDIGTLRSRGCSVVWCPRSNFATCGRTLTRDLLRSGIPVALGTDSALTTEGDLSDEIRMAHLECGVGIEELYEMVTARAALILRRRDGEGAIRTGGVADLIAVPDEGQTPAEALLELEPQLVIVRGAVRLASPRLAGLFVGNLSPLNHETRGRVFVAADIARLLAATRLAGPQCRLAGRLVTQ